MGRIPHSVHRDCPAGTHDAQLVPRYIATIEERLIVEYEPEAETSERVIVPDVSIVEEFPSLSSVVTVAAPAVVAEVVQVVAPIAEKAKEVKIAELPEYEHRERFIEIRVRETGELVTVIELLSPANKQRGQYRLAPLLAEAA